MDAKRDWGYAPEYVEAMWMMLQQDEPQDYVIGTGENHTVQEFMELAFARVGLAWKDYVIVDPRYYRPAEVDSLLADVSKARQQLGWQHRTAFKDLVGIMVDAEMRAITAPSTSSRTRYDDHPAGVPSGR
jgi:GDPmannose 4,6-dehydratase